MKLEFSQQI